MNDLFSSWAIVELMGHRRVVGKAEEVEIAGGKLLRVDVPEVDGKQAYSQFYGAGSIYCLSPVTEEVAMQFLTRGRSEPWFAWEMPRQIETQEPETEPGQEYDPDDEGDDEMRF